MKAKTHRFIWFLLLVLGVSRAIHVFEVFDLEKAARKSLTEFEKSHPVPWSEADHKLRDELRQGREGLRKQVASGTLEILFVVALAVLLHKELANPDPGNDSVNSFFLCVFCVLCVILCVILNSQSPIPNS